jgi:hypothetical protein
VEISVALVGHPSSANTTDAPVITAIANRTTVIAKRRVVISERCDMPASYWPGVDERSSARIFLVRRSRSPRLPRWGTEPEGWYVDLPDAVFMAGVNYSPLEQSELSAGCGFCQS